VAAEVIGLPEGSIGERLYQAKIFLTSADLFAWTAVVIALSFALERLVVALLGRAERRLSGGRAA
jgi:NitT/TauT family transport system permease protein